MELRPLIEPIVLDQTLTKQERQKKLIPILLQWTEYMAKEGHEFDEIMNQWNLTMVEIVEAHNLGRH